MQDNNVVQYTCSKCGAKANVQSFRVSTPGVAPKPKLVCGSCGHQQDLPDDPPKISSSPSTTPL